MKAIIVFAVIVLIGIAGCTGPPGPEGSQGPPGPEGPLGTDGAQQEVNKAIIYASYEKYQGNGYVVYYPSSWFLANITPDEIRLTPPDNSGLIAITATNEGARVIASGYYWNQPLGLSVQESLLRDYGNAMGIDNIEVVYNGPVVKSLELYEDWNWLISFKGLYRGMEVTGLYLIRDVPEPFSPNHLRSVSSYDFLTVTPLGKVGETVGPYFWDFLAIRESFSLTDLD